MTSVAMEEPSRRTWQTTLILPRFDVSVPMIVEDPGLHWIPVVAISRLLGVDHTWCLLRATHTMMWEGAQVFKVEDGKHVRWAWCLPYPLGIGFFMDHIVRDVHDPVLIACIDQMVDDCMDISSRAMDQVHATFVNGKKRMFHLYHALDELRSAVTHLRSHEDQWMTSQLAMLLQIEQDHDVLWQQAAPFIQEWLRQAGELPVVDAITTDAQGHVVGETTPYSILGVLSNEDDQALTAFEHACSAITHRLRTLLDTAGQ